MELKLTPSQQLRQKNIDKIIDLTGMEGFHESIISTKTRNHFDHEMLS